jgi:secreted trypsin-like serine protease
MAFVYFETPTEAGECSGTLVSSNVVLTAAHCVISEENVLHNPSRYVVVTGNTDWAAEPRTVSTVTRIAVPAGYHYSGLYAYDHDAAVLQLTSPVTAPSVRLATTAPIGGTGVTIVGWGRRSPEVQPPTSLGYGNTVVQSMAYCAEHVSGFDMAAEFCSLDYPTYYQAPCHGDSGGPFLSWAGSEWIEVGIVSHGAEECPTTLPAVGTRVDAFASWITTKINEWAPPPPTPPAPIPSAPTPTTPAPTPAPTLPTMTGAAALRYLLVGLREGLGFRFRPHEDYRASCFKLLSTAQKCSAHWYNGAFFYRGSVRVYYAIEEGKVVWADRYRVTRVSSRCYSHCPTRVFTN